jgi:hypothetical protein
MSSEEQSLLTEIARKLDVLIALTAAAGKELDVQIEVLTLLGYRPTFIGPIVGLAPNAIVKRLSRKKQAEKRVRRKVKG